MRLIDADEVLERAIPVRGVYDNRVPFEAVPVGYIKGAPTAKIESVQYGRWRNYNLIGAECSNCKAVFLKPEAYHCKYCPACGAKMRWEADDVGNRQNV